MLSPHEIATLLLAAASLGPIDADALELPDLAALEQARLVHVAVNEGQAQVTVTEDGHRVLRRLGLEPVKGERKDAQRPTMMAAPRAVSNEGISMAGRSGGKEVAREARHVGRDGNDAGAQQAASLPAGSIDPAGRSEHREEEA
ncbi:hypothetical protein [Pandoraea pulmonicola]|nr:hypothetical protein [Pandoraea pulmonicola]SUA89472.1 Uncharacterised protein [Pandoraea pulmonicola]